MLPFMPCRFYVENIMQLKDIITVELFFLNAKFAVYNVSDLFFFLSQFLSVFLCVCVCVCKCAVVSVCFAHSSLMIHYLCSAQISCRARSFHFTGWNVMQSV